MKVASSQEIQQVHINFSNDSSPRHHTSHKDRYIPTLDRMASIALPIIFILLISTVFYKAKNVQGTQKEIEQISSMQQMIASDMKIQDYQPKDFYWFSVSTKDLILNSDLDSLYRRDRKVYSIDRDTHMRGILLTQLIHNVNFKGQIQVEMSPFDTDAKRKEQVIQKVMDYEKNYYNKQYNISQYHDTQLPFCIVVPSYNNVKSRLYRRNLDSLFMQDYKNYRVVYIDDHSPEKTGEFVQQYLDQKAIPNDKINLIINPVNKKALQNIYQGIHQHCKDGEIVGLIDGDDSFNGRQVLSLYNAVFHQKKAGLIYSNFLKITSNSRTQFGFGSQVSKEYFEAGYLRTYWPIVGTHFMAFYADIFKKIKKQDLCYDNGTFYDYAYDRAIITPLLQLSHPRNVYVPEMIYEYRNDTGVNDGGYDWKRVSNLIQDRDAYEPLKDFGFIDEHPVISQGEKSQKRY